MISIKQLDSPHQLPLFWMILAVAFCFEPKLFVSYQPLNLLYIGGAVAVFLCLVVTYVRRSVPISKMMAAVIIYRLSFGFQTILADGDILMWGYMSLVLINLCGLFDYFAPTSSKRLLSSIRSVLCSYLAINAIIAAIFPSGIIERMYFIGIRTRVTDLIFPLLATTLTLDYMNGKRVSIQTLACLLASIANVMLLWVGTAIVGLCLAAFVLLLISKSKRLIDSSTVKVIAIASIILTVLVVIFHIQDLFAWFITGVLGKDLTLTYRTNIWDEALGIILESPFVGHGMAIDGTFVEWGTTVIEMRQAHNQWLQLAYDGGLIAIGSFVGLFFVAADGVRRLGRHFPAKVLVAVIASFCVMFTSEIYSYTPYFFIVLFMCSHMKTLLTGGACDER